MAKKQEGAPEKAPVPGTIMTWRCVLLDGEVRLYIDHILHGEQG